MNEKVKKYVIGGGIFSGLAIMGLFLYNRKRVKVDQSIKQVPRETILKMLKDFKKNMFSTC